MPSHRCPACSKSFTQIAGAVGLARHLKQNHPREYVRWVPRTGHYSFGRAQTALIAYAKKHGVPFKPVTKEERDARVRAGAMAAQKKIKAQGPYRCPFCSHKASYPQLRSQHIHRAHPAKFDRWRAKEGLSGPTDSRRNGQGRNRVRPSDNGIVKVDPAAAAFPPEGHDAPPIDMNARVDAALQDLYAQRAAIDGRINTLLALKREPGERAPRPEGRLNGHSRRRIATKTRPMIEKLHTLLHDHAMTPNEAFAHLVGQGLNGFGSVDVVQRQIQYLIPHHKELFRRLSSGKYITKPGTIVPQEA